MLFRSLQLSTHSDLIDRIAMILAGGVAERMILGEHSIGVSGDVQQAKQIIEQMVDTGLLQEGFSLTFSKGLKETKMQELFDDALEKSEMIINAHKHQFDVLVEELLKKETLEGSEVDEIVQDKTGFREDQYVMA